MLCLALLTSLLVSPAHAQEAPPAPPPAAQPAVPRFTRTAVGSCGCALYAPPGLVFDAPSKSEDGADVWTAEVTSDGWTFGAIVVRFAEPMSGSDGDALEGLLVSYMQFLQSQAEVTGSAGVGRGHTHPENPAARGVIDYWKDKGGQSWAVKGWVDSQRLAVLYVRGVGDYPYFSAQQMYLDGFRFTP